MTLSPASLSTASGSVATLDCGDAPDTSPLCCQDCDHPQVTPPTEDPMPPFRRPQRRRPVHRRGSLPQIGPASTLDDPFFPFDRQRLLEQSYLRPLRRAAGVIFEKKSGHGVPTAGSGSSSQSGETVVVPF